MADSDKTYLDAPPNTRELTGDTSLTGAGAVEHRALDDEPIDMGLPADTEHNPPGTPPSLRPGGAPMTEVASELPTRRGPFGDRHEEG